MWVGIDPSLTGTAIAVIHDDGHLTSARLSTKGEDHAPHSSTRRRLDQIERWLRHQLEDLGRIDLSIGIEGPSLSPKRLGMDHERAGLWWRLYTRASHYADGDLVVVPPKSRAKYASGNGNAGKDIVMISFLRRHPDFTGTTNDEIDAAVIAAMLARLDGHPIETSLPQACLAALDKLVVA